MEYFTSFFQNIKDKLTNPFFGTLIIVLIVHHPQFWFSLFNFDDGVNLRQKVDYLSKLGAQEFTSNAVINDVLCALFFMLLGYLIVVGTRALSMWIEYNVMPIITKNIVSKNLVLRTEYDEVVKERDEYSDKYEEQRKNGRIQSKNYDELLEEANKKNTQINELQSDITTLNNNIAVEKSTANHFKTSFEALEKEKTELDNKYDKLLNNAVVLDSAKEDFMDLYFGTENLGFYTDSMKFPPSIREKANELKHDVMWDLFLRLGEYFEKGGSVSLDVMKKMEEYGIVITDNMGKERLTPTGLILWRYRKLFN